MSVYDEIAAERARQIEKGYTPEHDDEHGVNHITGWARRYVPYAGWIDTRERAIQAAALLVAAVEAIDRAAQDHLTDHTNGDAG
jgi:hypothetical protein